MNQYKPGDKVKIISMDKVRSYPKRGKDYKIGNEMWLPLMNSLAGTIQKIEFVDDGLYDMESIAYTFSPEMIEGPADPVGKSIYIASKTKHAQKWLALRESGVNIISSWIDEWEPGKSSNLADLAHRCIAESKKCDAFILYHEPEDILKGAYIELGSAMTDPSRKPIYIIGKPFKNGSCFDKVENIFYCKSISEAVYKITGKSVDTIHKYIFDCDEQQAREMTWEEKQEHLNPNYIDPVEQEGEGQEENLEKVYTEWLETADLFLESPAKTLRQFLIYLSNNYTITRKNNPQ